MGGLNFSEEEGFDHFLTNEREYMFPHNGKPWILHKYCLGETASISNPRFFRTTKCEKSF